MQNYQQESTNHASAEVTMDVQPLFRLGQICATPGAIDAMREAGKQPVEFLSRHFFGDWSEMSAEDQQENRLSVARGRRIVSRYALCDRKSIWVITEADRGVTTILLPSEY